MSGGVSGLGAWDPKGVWGVRVHRERGLSDVRDIRSSKYVKH